MTGLMIGAWLDLRTKPLRTVVAIAAMVAAVLAVVLVDAASVLSRHANDEYLARQFGLPVTESVYADRRASTAGEDRMQAALAGQGFTASPDVTVTLMIQNGDSFVPVVVRWVSSAYNRIRVVDLVAGAWPEATARSATLHVVISEQLAANLGYASQDAIGRVLVHGPPNGVGERFNGQATPLNEAVVDAVAAETSNALADVQLLIVSDLPQPALLGEGQCMSWLVRTNPDDTGALSQLVRGISDDSGQPIYSLQRVDQSAQVAPVLDQQGVTAAIVTLVALTVGGLGILGTGLATVRERGTEFGISRALGASTKRIFASVIVQTLFEVLLAAAVAIPLAAVAVELFTRQLVLAELPLPPSRSLPVGSALEGLVGALVVGLLAGLVPAINAARTSVVRALRG